jgi:hypothetical protein
MKTDNPFLEGIASPHNKCPRAHKHDKLSHHAKRDCMTFKVTQKVCRLGLVRFHTNSDGLVGQIVQNYFNIHGVKNQNSLR